MKYPECIYCAEYDRTYDCCCYIYTGQCEHLKGEAEEEAIEPLTDEEYKKLQEAMKDFEKIEMPF